MQRNKWNQIEWLEFDLLADFPKVKHAIFLRHGGHSQGPYASLNTGLHVGDNPDNVTANIKLIQQQLIQECPNWRNLVWGRANHGKAIAHIDCKSPQELIDFDGLITSTPGLTLVMKHADCQIALIYDPKHHAAANVHSGWRGSVANIYREAVTAMQKAFNSNPSDLLVCISPSLGPEEAEFMHYRSELPEEFWHFQVRPTYFDFWSITEFQLQAAGILPHHIEVARLSTYANPYDFFSHRRDKITGRHAACITLA
jgi:YfiH family protein